jgi:acyl-CoA reductase-like NAD-dependent aldehyde dehydrogenase
MFMAYKIAAALVAGNSTIVKVPEQATASMAFCLRLILPLLPEGILDSVSGKGKAAGNALVTHGGIHKISFTGSVETGKHIYRQAAETMRSATLEPGGKSPMIILEDCDLDKEVSGIIKSMRFTRAGQSCTAASRIYVPSSKLGLYREKLATALNAIPIGDALDADIDSGAVVSAVQQGRIQCYIDRARADGLDVVAYGTILEPKTFETGYLVQPHIIYNPDPDHMVSQEEIFGPVATLTGYEGVSEVVDLANNSEFGLSASVWG